MVRKSCVLLALIDEVAASCCIYVLKEMCGVVNRSSGQSLSWVNMQKCIQSLPKSNNYTDGLGTRLKMESRTYGYHTAIHGRMGQKTEKGEPD